MSKSAEIRDAILRTVATQGPIKGVDLALNVMGMVNPVMFSHDEYVTEVVKLVDEGEIVEVEYILPQYNYRMKSLYFPKGSKLGAKTLDWNNDTPTRIQHGEHPSW